MRPIPNTSPLIICPAHEEPAHIVGFMGMTQKHTQKGKIHILSCGCKVKRAPSGAYKVAEATGKERKTL